MEQDGAKPFGFTNSNQYFGFLVWTWNLPSGYSCPGALRCLAYAQRETGRIKNGPYQSYRCYSATTERYPAVRDKAWANFEAVKRKSAEEVAEVLSSCWPAAATHIRIHAGGDFFSQAYFDGWLVACRAKPSVKLWAFTKSLPYWLARREEIPQNLCLQASYGGRHDALIEEHGLKSARVVRSLEEATRHRLRIDTDDDKLAMEGSESFALLENFSRRRRHDPRTSRALPTASEGIEPVRSRRSPLPIASDGAEQE